MKYKIAQDIRSVSMWKVYHKVRDVTNKIEFVGGFADGLVSTLYLNHMTSKMTRSSVTRTLLASHYNFPR